jgi:alkanesulfonate monooxygenase SsuD/methylene tetrahydromethanopterin reductase-like flavin-dependent oxidoreductase (luciferase family)
MKLGLYVRNMGPQSTRALIAEAARAAEGTGINDLWVADHLALAPEDSQGSDGRYVEPLATLAFLAGITERVTPGRERADRPLSSRPADREVDRTERRSRA